MESVVDASTKIFNELSSDDREVRAEYFKYFESDRSESVKRLTVGCADINVIALKETCI